MNHHQKLIACKVCNHIVRRRLARVRQLSAENVALAAACKALQAENENYGLKLAECEAKLRTTAREYEALYNSKSWLYSAPIRKLLNKIVMVKKKARRLTESCQRTLATVGSSFGINSDWVLKVNRFKGNIAIVQTAIDGIDGHCNHYPFRLAELLARNGFLVLSVSLLDDAVTQNGRPALSHPDIIPLRHDELVDKAAMINPGKNGSLLCFIGAPCRTIVTQLPKLRSAGFSIIVDVTRDWEFGHANGQFGWYEKDSEAQAVLCADVVCVASLPLKQKFSHLRGDVVCLDYYGADTDELTSSSTRCEQLLNQAMGRLYVRDIYA